MGGDAGEGEGKGSRVALLPLLPEAWLLPWLSGREPAASVSHSCILCGQPPLRCLSERKGVMGNVSLNGCIERELESKEVAGRLWLHFPLH